MQTHFTLIIGANSQYNEITDIAKSATNGWLSLTDGIIYIHSTHNIDTSNPFVNIRLRLFY